MKSRCFPTTVFFLVLITLFMMSSHVQAGSHLYDNNDQYLGVLIDMNFSAFSVLIPSLEAIYYHSDDASGRCGDETAFIYESGDCSGQAYSFAKNPWVFDCGVCGVDAMQGFYKTDYSGRKTFTPGSYYDEDTRGCRSNIDEWGYLVHDRDEYYPYAPVQVPFTLPIAYPLKIKVDDTPITTTKIRTVVIPME